MFFDAEIPDTLDQGISGLRFSIDVFNVLGGDAFMSGLLKGWLDELTYFLNEGIVKHAVRKDEKLNQIHWSNTRLGEWPEMKVFA